MPKLILRCPKCETRGHIRYRFRTKERVCAYCGYVGDPKEFEVNPDKPKK